MSSLRQPVRPSMPAEAEESSMPALEKGDHLDQNTFHEHYEKERRETGT